MNSAKTNVIEAHLAEDPVNYEAVATAMRPIWLGANRAEARQVLKDFLRGPKTAGGVWFDWDDD